MAFFTRPDLVDEQFKQLSGGTLTLSGETNFSGVLKSKGVEIDASTGGTLAGYVLTFDGTKIVLDNLTGTSNTGVYTLSSPSTTTVGGMSSGTVLTGRTIENILEEILVPFQEPLFSSFINTDVPTLSEVGNPNNWATPFDFTWGTTNSGNVSANTLSIIDITSGSTVIASGLTNDGAETVTGFTVTNTSAISYQWRITGVDTQGGSFQRDYNISTIYPWFYGTFASGGAAAGANRPDPSVSGQSLIDDTGTTKVVASSTGTITVPNFASTSDDYIWFAIPSTATSKTVWYVDALNNGAIGGAVGGANLFPAASTVSLNSPDTYWSSVNYKFYVSNVQTTATSMEFRNS